MREWTPKSEDGKIDPLEKDGRIIEELKWSVALVLPWTTSQKGIGRRYYIWSKRTRLCTSNSLVEKSALLKRRKLQDTVMTRSQKNVPNRGPETLNRKLDTLMDFVANPGHDKDFGSSPVTEWLSRCRRGCGATHESVKDGNPSCSKVQLPLPSNGKCTSSLLELFFWGRSNSNRQLVCTLHLTTTDSTV